MVNLSVGVVDVFVLRGTGDDLRVLLMRRSAGTRCTGAWEVVHGRIDGDERPEDAAVREVLEETGLHIEKLYNVICQPFYLHRSSTVQIAVVFAAFVAPAAAVLLGAEHDAFDWLPPADALEHLSWPRSRSALADALSLLRDGNAGPVEDVLRIR